MRKLDLEKFLKKGKIIEEDETLNDLQDRVIDSIVDEEKIFDVSKNEQEKYRERLKKRFSARQFVPSTTILTNAGRYEDKPLTACSVPPISLKEDLPKIKATVDHYHEQGMGTGFDFNESCDPCAMIQYLNDVAIEGLSSDKQDRPVGNMGLISINHPKIEDFIEVKDNENKNKQWAFNISVNITEDFMDALKNNKAYKLADGNEINPDGLLDRIAKSACSCGDPGLVFLERFERDNPAPHLGKYKSLAPCGEVAMADGETCQFSYINLGNFVKDEQIDYDELKGTIGDVVRFLDDALEKSIRSYGNERSELIMSQKRKIGVGVCGFADLLVKLRVPYDSDEAKNIAGNVMSFLNYNTKVASVELARERGPFPAYHDKETRIGKGFLMQRYGGLETKTVSQSDWERLSEDVNMYGIRHVSTTALPPTGRSSTTIMASPSIEPLFSLGYEACKNLEEMLTGQGVSQEYIKSVRDHIEKEGKITDATILPKDVRDVYKTCLDIEPDRHLDIVAEFQKYTDESISKTINMESDTTPEEIKNLYIQAYDMGLKGVTVYRNGSKDNQPEIREGKK